MSVLIQKNILVMVTDSSAAVASLKATRKVAPHDMVTVAYSPKHLPQTRVSLGSLCKSEKRYRPLQGVEPSRFDVLIIPDGLGNPARRDFDPAAVAVVRHFLLTGKRILFYGEDKVTCLGSS